jgi:hypothetical protein
VRFKEIFGTTARALDAVDGFPHNVRESRGAIVMQVC